MFCVRMRGSYCILMFFFFKQKTAYEMRISDWSSDVCSSDLDRADRARQQVDHFLPRLTRRRIRPGRVFFAECLQHAFDAFSECRLQIARLTCRVTAQRCHGTTPGALVAMVP